IAGLMFSNGRIDALAEGPAELSQPLAENPRVKQIAGKVRSQVGQTAAVPKAKQYTVADGIFEAVAHAAATDPSLVIYGEENRDWGGAFGCYRGLTELLP